MTSPSKALDDLASKLGGERRIVEGWGLSTRSEAVVVEAKDVAAVHTCLSWARENAGKIGLLGAGCSYGDASQNEGRVVLDLSRMDAIRHFDKEQGLCVVEPGVTIEKLWRSVIAEGFWPPVVPGTMFATLGGMLAMNVHGKNNYCAGTIGEHVESFRICDGAGVEQRCSRDENAELFHAAIGGFGMLGCITEITLRLKRVQSGYVDVDAIATPTLRDMICFFETESEAYDYLVGWIDCFPGGRSLGRGIIHGARHVTTGETDEDPAAGLKESAQDLPPRLFKVIPKRWLWRMLKPFLNDLGMRAVNAAKYRAGVRGQTRGVPIRQAHAAFHFLLDYVPDWRKSYLPGGLIQYQSFVPRDRAAEVHGSLISLCHRAGLIPYLGVYKRHRPDPFLLTHAVDGFSFAMDFKVTAQNRRRLWELAHRMDEVVLEAGGRFYFAKDATLLAESAQRIWPHADLARFVELKRQHDPAGILETSLSRRLFPAWSSAARSVAPVPEAEAEAGA